MTGAAPLVGAIERLADRSPELAARLEVEIVGRCTPAEESQVRRLAGLPCRLLRQQYVDHDSAVQTMQNADDLILLLADLPGAERVVPGKTFEYLATGRSLLAITPNGELRRLLSGFAGVSAYAPADTSGICDYLARRLATPKKAELYPRDVAHFDRRNQADRLANLLQRAATASAPALTGLPQASATPV